MKILENINKEELGKQIAEKHNKYIHKDGRESVITKQPFRMFYLNVGSFVTIKSVHTEEDSENTFIGIYLGTIPFITDNPVFFVPKLEKILAGFESWWRPIPKEDYLLSCEDMKQKHNFSWEDIEKYCKRLLKIGESIG